MLLRQNMTKHVYVRIMWLSIKDIIYYVIKCTIRTCNRNITYIVKSSIYAHIYLYQDSNNGNKIFDKFYR